MLTANIGGYDAPPRMQTPQTVEAVWVYFTDDLDVFQRCDVPPWQYIAIRGTILERQPRLIAKVPKLTPWAVLHGEARYAVWIDANMEIVAPTFIEEAIAEMNGAPLITSRHPRRNNVYTEAAASFVEAPGKYGPMRPQIRRQVESYLAAGFPGMPLYACGALVWDLHHPLARPLGEAWLGEVQCHTVQDQLSLPYAAWRLQAPVATFSEPQLRRRIGYFGNRWVRIHAHARED